MDIYLYHNDKYGNIWVLDMEKVFPERGYTKKSYHAVCNKYSKRLERLENMNSFLIGKIVLFSTARAPTTK